MHVWRLIDDLPRTGSFNMAADEVLLEQHRQGAPPVLRIYEWDRPTLSLGRNEKTDRQINLNWCEAQRIPVIRRITGGKAVLHGKDITYSVVGCVNHQPFSGGILEIYRFLARGFMRFFESLDLRPVLVNPSRPVKNVPHLCFAEPAVHEILVEGRKIIGNAQRIKSCMNHKGKGRVFLQHGSIPLEDPIPLMLKIFPAALEQELRNQMHSLETAGVFPRYSKTQLRRLLIQCFQDVFSVNWERAGWSEKETTLIKKKARTFTALEKMGSRT